MELQGLPLAGLISLTLKNTLTYFYKKWFGNRKFFHEFVMGRILVLISMRLDRYEQRVAQVVLLHLSLRIFNKNNHQNIFEVSGKSCIFAM